MDADWYDRHGIRWIVKSAGHHNKIHIPKAVRDRIKVYDMPVAAPWKVRRVKLWGPVHEWIDWDSHVYVYIYIFIYDICIIYISM